MQLAVTTDSWVIIHTRDKGPVKFIGMKRDALRILSMGRRGTFPARALLGMPFNEFLVWSPEDKAFSVGGTKEAPTAKHAKKKFNKHSVEILLRTPTLHDIISMYIQKGDLHVSHEAAAEVLFHAIGTKYVIVKDDHKSVLLGAVAMARGTKNLYRIGGSTADLAILGALGHPMKIEEYSIPVCDKTVCDAEGVKCPGSAMGCAESAVCDSPSTCTETASVCPDSAMGCAESRQKGVLLVLAQKEKYIAEEVVSLLKSIPLHMKPESAYVDFLVYHPVKEALLDLFNAMMTNKSFCLLDLREHFYREYQGTLGAIHPTMSKLGHSGFVLTGTFLDN
ncbi:hypothetical protein NEPAR06_2037 [Nematocida parisii]|uniref:tRNA (adenine(58)-N(1))-methyltransferase non-catalytic subunit TRM6 n=1 Tax=Nematocida parisii (strain ERTm3) TaxID=935791 RepID=I3EDW9_NEMP3|nr:uncharacterized protein NEPG_00018 [Nematocida parisii ERTm1]EIJ87416.1 hypothetical protein NEQG_02297 [Nematocida parisii ERTm3]KAI5129594.1 hypothetical protein NEPAR08_1670 [Nematocida parisii]EIJ94496.1 hypothetical protein NEPG_00018 [Nematocida parisii ERTm1]KAI5129627.1 hypothetical protein NEPAR03_1757 [Nematocida parisii]KAI5142240.1 hypothetical protein NEPAR04_1486 [Nematocida parisii]|eukprot:XP_013057852.1 hypothetical protein NEPG_00018 [Nematocida parisii ERTm1]